MTTRMFGEPVQRLEDPRLLTGRGHYTDDFEHDAAHAVFVRTDFAHARILGIDTSEAAALPGVLGVFTHEDLEGDFAEPLPLLIPNDGLTAPRTQRALAKDEVCYAGEVVAMVVATDRYIGEDAASLVRIDYEPLPVVAPDIGVGFGVKVVQFYPEEVLVPWAARRLGVTVKWTEDRREHFIGSTQERGQIHDVRVAVDDEGRILALETRFVHDA